MVVIRYVSKTLARLESNLTLDCAGVSVFMLGFLWLNKNKIKREEKGSYFFFLARLHYLVVF